MNMSKEKRNRIYIIIGSFVFVWIFLFMANFLRENNNSTNVEQASIEAFQASGTGRYTTLSGAPMVTPPEGGNDFAGFLVTLYQWGISIAVILSVLYIIFGGIRYMTTDSISGKSEGKETIKSALIGLILALSAWLILYTINPQLISLEITSSPGAN